MLISRLRGVKVEKSSAPVCCTISESVAPNGKVLGIILIDSSLPKSWSRSLVRRVQFSCVIGGENFISHPSVQFIPNFDGALIVTLILWGQNFNFVRLPVGEMSN